MNTATLVQEINKLGFPRVAKRHLKVLQTHKRLVQDAESRHKVLGTRLVRMIAARFRRALPGAIVEVTSPAGYLIDWSGKRNVVSPYLGFRINVRQGLLVNVWTSPKSGAELDKWTQDVIAWLRTAP